MEKLKMEIEEKSRSHGLGIRHLQAVLTGVCATVIYVMRSSMGVAVLAMTDKNNINSTTVTVYPWNEQIRGVVLSSFFWGYTIMQVPAGILAKRFGGKPMLLSALVINGILCLVTPVLAAFGGWIAVCMVRMTMGLTQACFMPSVHTILGRWAPPSERTRLGVVAYTGIQIGTILTMPICGVLSATSLGWTMIFYAMGGLAGVAVIVWWAFSASSPREHRWVKEAELEYIENSLNSSGKACPPIPWRSIFTSGPLYAIAVTHIGMNWTFLMFLVEMPTYLKEALGIDLRESSSLSALPFLVQWIVQAVAGVLSDYFYNKKILSLSNCRKLFNTIGCVGAASGLIAMSFLTSEYKVTAVIVMALTGGILGSCACGYTLNHIDLSPNFGGIMFGITNCVANLIGILAPLSTGFILGDYPTDIARWRIVFFLATSLIVFGDLIYRFFGTSELQAWNDPKPDLYELVVSDASDCTHAALYAVMSISKGDYKTVPKKEGNDDPPLYEAPEFFGARHVQAAILFTSLSVGFTMKSHLSVAMVAMTMKDSCDAGNTSEVSCHKEWTVFQTYDWNKKQQEVMLFAFFVGYTIMMVPMGIIAQKFGGKLPIMIALAVNGIMSIITPWVPTFAGWMGVCLCRFLQGSTQAAFHPSIHTLLGKWAPLSERGRLSTYVYTGSQFGTVISFQISGLFCGSPDLGWPYSFWLWGGLSLVCFGLLARFGSDCPHQHKTISSVELAFIMGDCAADAIPKKRPTPWRHILTSRAVWAMVAAHTGSAVGYLFILTQLPLYMDKVLGVDIKNNGVLSSLPYIAMYSMALVFGFVTDFLRNHNYMKLINIRRISNSIGMVLSSVFLLWMCYVDDTWLAVTLLVISLGLHSGVHTGFHINQIDLAPNFAGPMMGVGNMVANLSGLSIPFLVANIVGDDVTNHHKWQITFIIIVVLQVITNTVYVVFVKVDLQQWNFYGDDENDSIGSEEMRVLKDNSIVIKVKSPKS